MSDPRIAAMNAEVWLEDTQDQQDLEIGGPFAAGFVSRRLNALRPGLILDRDGVLVEEVNYLSRVEDVKIEPGIPELLRWARSAGLPVGIATNQAGIARGMFDWPSYRKVMEKIRADLESAGCHVDSVVACGFHPEHTPGYSDDHAYWRKPGPGMLHVLADKLSIDLHRSWLVGDNVSDILAARAAGMAGAIHVNTGHGRRYRDEALKSATATFRVIPCEDANETLRALQQVISTA